MSYECVYCKSYNYKKGLIDELEDVFDGDDCNYDISKQYILWVQSWKHNKNILLLEPYDDDKIVFCLPCDDE